MLVSENHASEPLQSLAVLELVVPGGPLMGGKLRTSSHLGSEEAWCPHSEGMPGVGPYTATG